MSVYKELRSVVDVIEKGSKQIYTDSIDFGMPVKSKTDPIVKTIKGIITQYKPSVDTHRYGTGSTQTITFNGGVG